MPQLMRQVDLSCLQLSCAEVLCAAAVGHEQSVMPSLRGFSLASMPAFSVQCLHSPYIHTLMC